jgi:hypothetical protein
MDRIYGLLGNTSIPALRISSLWHEYEDRQTEESKFVKDLDLYELCQQAVEYENCMSSVLLPLFSTNSPSFPHSATLQRPSGVLRDYHSSHPPPGRQAMGCHAVSLEAFVAFLSDADFYSLERVQHGRATNKVG